MKMRCRILEKIELVIFDMDGLILDTERLYLEYGLEVFKNLGYDITEEIFLGTVGMTDTGTGNYYIDLYGDDFNYDISIDNKTYVTVLILEKYRDKFNLNQEEMINLIDSLDITEFLESEYERLHLFGEQGMVNHLEKYIKHTLRGEEFDTFMGK